MSDCNQGCDSCSSCGESCSTCSSNQNREPLIEKAPMNKHSNVKKVIGVVSGKGGVGKSSVTSMLAAASRHKGLNVGVLDADITGPSIPKAFGVSGAPMATDENEIIPLLSNEGVEVMSTNLLLENDTDPVLWRGPLLGGVIEQFWSEVYWGDIDVMYVDMPPGTGDVALTVYQKLPVDGIVIVTSPQDLVAMIVEKAVKMANMMNIPVLGIVENMSYFECPDCGKKHEIFGESRVDAVAAAHNISRVAKLPIDSKISEACDNGEIEFYESKEMDRLAGELVE